MHLDEILGLLPLGPLYPFIRPSMLENVHVVREEEALANCIDLRDLPEDLQRHLREGGSFSGFHAPLMIEHGVEAHFIRVYGQLMPNRRFIGNYPSLLNEDLTFDEALDSHAHWIWGGGWRNTPLNPNRRECYLQPQTDYKAPNGRWRRVSVSSVLLGPERKPQCKLCLGGCLRPDHWWRDLAGGRGKGRKPNPYFDSRKTD